MHRSPFARVLALALLSVSLAAPAAPARAAVWRVKANAFGAADGKTWANAFRSIQAAVTASQPGDEIWVAEGVYYERVTLGAGLKLLGGFTGTETAPERVNPWAHPSTIDATNRNGPVVTIPPSAVNTTVDGFTLTNGSGLAEVFGEDVRGGGVHIRGSNATITRNIIRGNAVSALGGFYSIAAGGGLYAKDVAVTVANNIIQDNTAQAEIRPPYPVFSVQADALGGGMAFEGVIATVANNLVSGNRSVTVGNPREDHTVGSALYANYVTGLVTNNTFAANGLRPEAPGWTPADSAYGSVHLEYADTRLTLANNIVAFNGGGVQWSGGAVFRHNDVHGNGRDFIGPDYTGEFGDISADPLFMNGTYGNYHLLPGSPALDAGEDAAVFGALDLSGRPRILGARVDMGAYEFIPARRPVWYVRPDAPGTPRNGSSWEQAFSSIQAALDAVRPGEQVWVAQGTYTENLRLSTPDVCLYGGFAGSETSRDQRDPEAHVTILDGGHEDSALVFEPAITRATEVSGFTIRNGEGGHGGGILCMDGSRPVIRGNVITHNTAIRGGGVMVGRRSDPLIIGNVITDNDAPGGGGVEFWTSAGGTVANNLFVGNTANFGSQLFLSDGGTPLIGNNTFIGGSVDVWAGSKPLVNNVFHNTSVAVPDSRFLRHNGFSGTAPQGYGGVNGNVNGDPRFVDPANGDYRLQPESPFVNAGDSAVAVGPADLDGLPRVVPPAVDMGAYENQAPPPFTIPDVAAALRIAAGLSAARDSTARFNVVTEGDSANRIDLLDAVALARKVSGLEPNP